jgi:CDGSH-type Zn-finger protein
VVTIKVRQNGPYRVDGGADEVRVVDWNGVEYAVDKRPVALCRCGASTTKPFCDGSHSRVGFAAAEAAVPRAGDRPAT